MMFWLAFMTHVFGLLIASIMLLSLTKSLRGKCGAMHVSLNLDDLADGTKVELNIVGTGNVHN